MICDRCKQEIDGEQIPLNHMSGATDGMYMTAGYYEVGGDRWGKYSNPGEKNVCDDCMWHDPRFIAVYGKCYKEEK